MDIANNLPLHFYEQEKNRRTLYDLNGDLSQQIEFVVCNRRVCRGLGLDVSIFTLRVKSICCQPACGLLKYLLKCAILCQEDASVRREAAVKMTPLFLSFNFQRKFKIIRQTMLSAKIKIEIPFTCTVCVCMLCVLCVLRVCARRSVAIEVKHFKKYSASNFRKK